MILRVVEKTGFHYSRDWDGGSEPGVANNSARLSKTGFSIKMHFEG